MDSLSEVRRVREAMSDAVGHDIRGLIESINASVPKEERNARVISPGGDAETCATHSSTNSESSPKTE